MGISVNDEYYLKAALELAKKAQSAGEVPIGAVLVSKNEIVGQGWNTPISKNDPTAHAEINAIRDAAMKIENYRLVNTTLYVSLEPCSMCVGAMIWARVKRLVFGAFDPKSGAVTSAIELIDSQKHNHKIEWQGGILEDECSSLLKNFFTHRR